MTNFVALLDNYAKEHRIPRPTFWVHKSQNAMRFQFRQTVVIGQHTFIGACFRGTPKDALNEAARTAAEHLGLLSDQEPASSAQTSKTPKPAHLRPKKSPQPQAPLHDKSAVDSLNNTISLQLALIDKLKDDTNAYFKKLSVAETKIGVLTERISYLEAKLVKKKEKISRFKAASKARLESNNFELELAEENAKQLSENSNTAIITKIRSLVFTENECVSFVPTFHCENSERALRKLNDQFISGHFQDTSEAKNFDDSICTITNTERKKNDNDSEEDSDFLNINVAEQSSVQSEAEAADQVNDCRTAKSTSGLFNERNATSKGPSSQMEDVSSSTQKLFDSTGRLKRAYEAELVCDGDQRRPKRLICSEYDGESETASTIFHTETHSKMIDLGPRADSGSKTSAIVQCATPAESPQLYLKDLKQTQILGPSIALVPGVKYTTILSYMMPDFKALCDNHRIHIKRGVSAYLERSGYDLKACTVKTKAGKDTLSVPYELIREFEEWVYGELRRNFPDRSVNKLEK